MKYTKFFLSSKTILAALVAFFVQIGPMIGLSFSQDDGVMLTQQWDTIVTAVSAIIAMYGRVVADSTLSFKPTGGGTTLRSPAVVSILGLLLLVACTAVGPTLSLSPQARLYQAEANYLVVKEEASLYASRPFCSDTIVAYCADPSIVVKIDELTDSIDAYLEQARSAVALLDPALRGNKIEPLDRVTNNLRLLIAVLATAQVRKG